MTKLYEMDLEVQVCRLRNTAVFVLVMGMQIAWSLFRHSHLVGALFLAVITLQASVGSAIIMLDLKKDVAAAKATRKAL